MYDLITVIIAIAILAFYATDRFFLKKQNSDVTMEKEVKEAILSLFLYAEKQGWSDEAKMIYVYHKLDDLIPGLTLEKVIGEDTLATYLQKTYDLFKAKLYK